MNTAKYWNILFFSLLQLFVINTSQAVTLTATYGISLPPPPGGVSIDDSGFVRSTSAATPASAGNTINASYYPLATVIDATATATASATDLKAGATFNMTGFDTSILGEGFFINALAIISDTYTTTSAMDLFASPIFQLSGDLTSSSSEFTSSVNFFSTQYGSLFSQTSTSASTPPINTIIMPTAMPITGSIFLDFRLNTSVERTNTAIPAGDYMASADFTGTVNFLGFALFEDAEMTIPILSGVDILNGDGMAVPIISAPSAVPVPAAFWLFLSGLSLFIPLKRKSSAELKGTVLFN